MNALSQPSRENLENELRKLRKINQVLMDRVERNMDALGESQQGGNAFSLFQTAIALEGRVTERTGELTRLTQRLIHEISQRRETEKALLVAKHEAEQANLGKTLFLAAASHDLHQPLSAARLLLGLLAAEVTAGRPRELVGRVETALDTVTELIDAVLEISKLDSGAWGVTPTTFPIAPLLRRLEDEYGPQAASRGLQMTVMPSRAFVNTDRVLFRRAMNNLVSNAIRYTGTGRILIGCRRQKGKLRVEVWDTGIGIAASARPHIFDEFRQAATPPRHDDKGFGLGLAIVQRIVRLLGLAIDVRSRVGYGSCFSLTVPPGDPADAVPEPARTAGPTPGQPFTGLVAACIGSDRGILEPLETLLRSWGSRPVMAADLAAVRDAPEMQAAGPDLIIADGSQPNLAAVAALRQVFNRAIPAIMLCRKHSPPSRESVEALGCGFLEEPLQPAKLRAMMVHVLDQGPVD